MSSESKPSKTERIINARLKLMRRFKESIDKSPAQSDPNPLGTGPQNHHGMPQLPVGQVYTKKWPVLDLGIHPQISTEEWRLEIDGAVENSLSLN